MTNLKGDFPMAAITIQRVRLLASFISFIKSIFRRIGSVVQAIQEHDAPEETIFSPSTSIRNKAARTMRYIVMHSYYAQQKRKRRGKAIKRKLSYVSSAILEDYGAIVPRSRRKLYAKLGICPFTPYYN
jgi:hypothetical protein